MVVASVCLAVVVGRPVVRAVYVVSPVLAVRHRACAMWAGSPSWRSRRSFAAVVCRLVMRAVSVWGVILGVVCGWGIGVVSDGRVL